MTRVRRTPLARFTTKVSPEPNTGCWLWTAATNGNGYGSVEWGGRIWLAHRVAWTLANGPIPDGLCVLHRCDTPACVNPEHLFLGTHADNARDKMAKGRAGDQRGEANSSAKLTAAQVREIRARYAAGKTTYSALSAEYGVTRGAIGFIVFRQNWTHV